MSESVTICRVRPGRSGCDGRCEVILPKQRRRCRHRCFWEVGGRFVCDNHLAPACHGGRLSFVTSAEISLEEECGLGKASAEELRARISRLERELNLDGA